ncbi:MAG: MFS transporter [Anaerolineales bacterium]|nr:MFS transporter [Anaerolineales bacterium]
MWGLGGALFLIAFYQRVAPAVMGDELTRDFQLTAVGLGTLSAFYFYSYVPMQIPTGILTDLWGPRKLMASGALIASLGTVLFGLAPTITLASLGRFLIGGSVAVAFVATLQIAGRWLPPKQFALASGLTLLIGVLGAVFAGVPLQAGIDAFGWRAVMLGSAVLPFAAAIAIWFFVRDRPQEMGYTGFGIADTPPDQTSWQEVLKGIVEVLSYRNGWLLFIIPGGLGGAVLAFAGLWGVPFMKTHYGLSDNTAASLATTLLVTFALSGPLMGGLSDRIGRRKLPYLLGCLGATIGWAIIILVEGLPIWLFTTLLIVIGITSGTMIISFAFVRESVPSQLSGTAIGSCNMGLMLGPMILQPAIGSVLDRYWDGAQAAGQRLYSFEAYRAAFSLMLVWLVVSLILLTLTQETYCRPLIQPTKE